MRKHSKHLDFELNLIPFIDLLSTCICFLLITAVWLNVGSMSVKQAVGGQSAAETEKKPLMWVFLEVDGGLTLDVRESSLVPAAFKKLKLEGQGGRPNYLELGKVIGQIRSKEPSLKTALIQPKAQSNYEDIIDLMDSFKKAGLGDLGVVPL